MSQTKFTFCVLMHSIGGRSSKAKSYWQLVCCLLFPSILISLASAASDTAKTIDILKLSVPKHSHTRDYHHRLLILAMEKSRETFGDYEIWVLYKGYNSSRGFKELVKKDGNINIYRAVTSEEREKLAIPVRIPTRKGILSYRLIIIREEDKSLFDAVKTQDQLYALNAGVIHDWVLTSIMKSGGAKLTLVYDHRNLFTMLSGERFQYLSRGVNQVFGDADRKFPTKRKKLVIHPTLAIYLPMVTYHFVSPHQPRLAKRIQYGLEKAIDDGSMLSLLREKYGRILTRADLNNRHIIKIDNPFLPKTVPIDEERYWYKGKSLELNPKKK